MRVTHISRSLIPNGQLGLSLSNKTPLSNTNNNKGKNSNLTHFSPSFFGIIYFDTARKRYNQAVGAETQRETSHKFELKIEPKISEEYLPLFQKADIAKSFVPSILKKYENIYAYAQIVTDKVEQAYVSAFSTSPSETCTSILEEVDKNNIPVRQTIFNNRGKPEIIRDYKNNIAILFDKYSDDNSKFTVLVDCENIDNKETINAKESFTSKKGKISRYTTNCKAQVDTNDFYSNVAFSFLRGVFRGYDVDYTVAAGTEYSAEYFEFKIHPKYEYSFSPDKALLSRFVKNKVSVNGLIYHSSDEIVFPKQTSSFV